MAAIDPETQTRQRLKERARRHEEEIEAGLPRLVERLVDMGAERVLLFGSRARGDSRWFSDVDLVVVMPSELPFVQRLAHVYQNVRLGLGADILVYTPEEFAAGNPLIREALKEGKVLYERDDAGE